MKLLTVMTRRAPGCCAYCKSEVEVDERAACAHCLALHHVDCWEGDAACAACGETAVLRAEEVPSPPRYRRRYPGVHLSEAIEPNDPWKGGPTTSVAVMLFLGAAALLLLTVLAFAGRV